MVNIPVTVAQVFGPRRLVTVEEREWIVSAFAPVAAYFWPHVPQPDDEQKEPKVTVADDGTIVSAEPEQPVDKTRETWEAWNRKEEERRRRGC